MSQNLPPPCYQVYAASTLANLTFRQADLATRGLIHTMELECWVNHRLPSNPVALAKVLGFDVAEVAGALKTAMVFFKVDGETIYSPQLEDYRAHLNGIREKQKSGGKKGADITNGKKKQSAKLSNIELENDSAHPQVEAQVSSIVKQSKTKQSQNQPLGRAITPDPFVVEYEAAEAKEYARIKNGE